MADTYGGLGILDPTAGLGGMLKDQVSDQTEEQKKRKRLGLPDPNSGTSMAVQSLFGQDRGFTRPGV